MGESADAGESGAMSALRKFVRGVREKEADLEELLGMLKRDAWMASGQLPETSMNGRIMTFESWCHRYLILDGERFKSLLEPLMDMKLPMTKVDGGQVLLRDFGPDDHPHDNSYMWKVEYLVSGDEGLFHLWVKTAMFLAQNPALSVPMCMQ